MTTKRDVYIRDKPIKGVDIQKKKKKASKRVGGQEGRGRGNRITAALSKDKATPVWAVWEYESDMIHLETDKDVGSVCLLSVLGCRDGFFNKHNWLVVKSIPGLSPQMYRKHNGRGFVSFSVTIIIWAGINTCI